MGRPKPQSRKSAEQQPGKIWDTESKVDEFDGRKNTQAGDEGIEGGKWNRITSRRAVVVSRDNVRKV